MKPSDSGNDHGQSEIFENASIEWREDGIPFSRRFSDIYFSNPGGPQGQHGIPEDRRGVPEESTYVFLKANRLQERWRSRQENDQPAPRNFVVAELGFGTGLNFLSCWDLWHRQQRRAQHLRLHYIACERYPLTSDQLRHVLSHRPELENYSESLMTLYPDHSPGYHRLNLVSQDGRSEITLDLYYGDAAAMLNQQDAASMSVDAWFLDGFAPRVNPSLWSEEILKALARFSQPETTLSSYSVTGDFLRGLRRHGFEVEKRKGFGSKRHMLYASYQPNRTAKVSPKTAPRHRKPVLVIGAGLAGAATAHSLARRGYRVTVVEQQSEPAAGASGNPQAILQCRTGRTSTPATQFYLQAYLYSYREFSSLAGQNLAGQNTEGINWHACGVFNLEDVANNYGREPRTGVPPHYSEKVIRGLSLQEAPATTGFVAAGVTGESSAACLPHGGWLDPRALCRRYLSHDLITLMTSTTVDGINCDDDGTWLIRVSQTDPGLREDDAGGREDERILKAGAVVIANSFNGSGLVPEAGIPFTPSRGQVSFVPATEQSRHLASVLCSRSYITPAVQGTHCVGASYVREFRDLSLSAVEHDSNLAGIEQALPGLVPDSTKRSQLAGRVSVRSGTLDHMPAVGPAPDTNRLATAAGDPVPDVEAALHSPCSYRPGLYINAGHGSHGLSSCPLAAEMIASDIAGEPAPVQQAIRDCLNPARYLIRELKRRKHRHRFNKNLRPSSNPDHRND